MAEEKEEFIKKPQRPSPAGDVQQNPEASKAAAAKAALERAVAASKELSDKAAAEKAAQPKSGVVTARSLRVRKVHNTISEMVGGLVNGDKVTIYETWTDGKDTWARIGPDQWAAMIYEGETYIKFED